MEEKKEVIVSRIGDSGLYIEPVIVFEGDSLSDNLIPNPVPEGFYLPKWDGVKWVEGMSEEEIEELTNQSEEISELEILREENKMNAVAIMELASLLMSGSEWKVSKKNETKGSAYLGKPNSMTISTGSIHASDIKKDSSAHSK